jgi:hypothetical protein
MQTRSQTRYHIQEVQIKPTTTMKTRSQTRAQNQEKEKEKERANNYPMQDFYPIIDSYESFLKRKTLHQFIGNKLKEHQNVTNYWDRLRLIHELYFEIYENIDVFNKIQIIFTNDSSYFKFRNVIYNKAFELLSDLQTQEKFKFKNHEAHKMDIVNRKNLMALLEKVIQGLDENHLVM